MKIELLRVVLIGAITGFAFGLTVGYSGPATQLYSYLRNCTMYDVPSSCHDSGVCYWSNSTCRFLDERNEIPCSMMSRDECNQAERCDWQHKSGACVHATTWTATEQGLFGGIMLLGALLGALPTGSASDKFGRCRAIAVSGALSALGSVALIIGWSASSQSNDIVIFGVLLLGRFLCGLGIGIVCVASQLYVGEASPAQYAGLTGCVYQIFTTLGIFCAALLGLIIHRSVPFASTDHAQRYVQILNAAVLCSSVASLLVGLLVRESISDTGDDTTMHYMLQQTTTLLYDEAQPVPSSFSRPRPRTLSEKLATASWSSLRLPALSAVLLAAIQQLSGVNAIMTYAPQISESFGLQPLLGSVFIMALNLVVTPFSLPLAWRFTSGQIFVATGFITSLACFITAIPTLPAVYAQQDATTAAALSATGIAIFIIGFEMGLGPNFYILSQSIFPLRWRSEGCSFTLTCQFFFNAVLVWCYPVAVTDISGGKNASSQRLGTAIMFILFGTIGVCCTFVFWLVNMRRR